MNDYVKAPDSVLEIAQELIAKYHPMLKTCAIGFVLFTGEKKSKGKYIAGRTSKVSAKLLPLLSEEVDILIELSQDMWAIWDSHRCHALVDHELSHITLNNKAEWSTKGHDFEEFTDIIERWGFWTSDLISASRAFAQQNPKQLEMVEIVHGENAGKVVAIEVQRD